MKKQYAAWLFHPLLLLGCIASIDIARAQKAGSGSATVDGVKGVDKDAVDNVKSVETESVSAAAKVPPSSSSAQSVNKVDGVNTVEGVKASSRAAASIRAVDGVSGINAVKMKNLEAALLMKEGGDVRPSGGAVGGGKGKAAAALLGAPMEKPEAVVPTEDGRGKLQELEKLENSGS